MRLKLNCSFGFSDKPRFQKCFRKYRRKTGEII